MLAGLAIKGFGNEDPDYQVEAHLKALDWGVFKAFLKWQDNFALLKIFLECSGYVG